MNWDTSYIDLNNVIDTARGDPARLEKYLRQFQELIPQRMESLKRHIQQEDRIMIRQILHKMSPQLQFFGVPGITIPIQRLEFEYQTMPMAELKAVVTEILATLDAACAEIDRVLNTYFE